MAKYHAVSPVWFSFDVPPRPAVTDSYRCEYCGCIFRVDVSCGCGANRPQAVTLTGVFNTPITQPTQLR